MKIAVVCELNEMGLTPIKSVLSKLQKLNMEINLIVLKTSDILLPELPCEAVYVYSKMTSFDITEQLVEATVHFYTEYQPALLVVCHDFSDNIVPRVMIKINNTADNHLASIVNCDDVGYDHEKRQFIVDKMVYGGNVTAHYCLENTGIISFKIAQKTDDVLICKTPEVHDVTYSFHSDYSYVLKTEMEECSSDGLKEATFVVVCGMGVGSKKAVEAIVRWATSIGAAVGGTKKVIDHGWLPLQQLIGQTGLAITPKTCLVMGASGATPFINGIIGSECIIAINNDEDARIFDYADVGIVEDLNKVMSEVMMLDHR